MYKILLMGPQGSGKGTQASRLSERLNIPALSMGQLLREEIAAKSEIGKKVEAIILGGNLVSDEDAAEVLKFRLTKDDAKKGYILDGYPRNASQEAAFDFDVPTHVIVIDLSTEESLTRLSGRLTCEACGKVYSKSDGHNEGDACSCGGVMRVRDDDTPESIQKRLDIYHKDTVPVVETYAAKGLVTHIDGNGGPEVVEERLLSILGIV